MPRKKLKLPKQQTFQAPANILKRALALRFSDNIAKTKVVENYLM